MSCSGQKDGLALNHPPFVIAVVGNNCAVPKEGNPFRRRGKADAGFLHHGEDAPPSILVFVCEDVIEDVLQRLPLKARGSAIAEPVVNLHEGFDKFDRTEAVGEVEQHLVVHGDGVVVIDEGHKRLLSAPFSRETLYLFVAETYGERLFIYTR